MTDVYENYSLEELESELAQVRAIVCLTDAQDNRKEAREIKLGKAIEKKRRENMPTYEAEMTLTVTMAGPNALNLITLLKNEILSNPNIDIESLIISKK